MQPFMQADSPVRFTTYTGAAIGHTLADFQRMHVAVFHDWPYLYDGDPRETPYIAPYVDLPRAALFLGRAQIEGENRIVALATCLPLENESANVQAPFIARGLDPRRFFYFGEGLVLREWRKRGLGQRIFELRESHARAVSTADYAVFCSVRRPADHPLRPRDAQTNDAFWRRRGYQPMDGVSCTMTWKDRGEPAETKHTLDFWIRSLTGAPLP
jgi:GNAT superfamily N-acetyltransferase